MKRWMIIALAAVVVLAVVGGVLALCLRGDDTPTWQEQYDLGVRYLSEGRYEEAIIAFNAAIEIDPKREDAYLAMADVYMEQGNYEQAQAVLNQGLAAVENTDSIADKLTEVEEMAEQQAEPSPGPGPEPEPEPEPGDIYDPYGQSLLMQGLTDNMIRAEEIHFLGHSIDYLDIETMESILRANGFDVIDNGDEDDYWWIQGTLGDSAEISALQNKDEGYVVLWSYTDYGDSMDDLPIGIRNIHTGDSLETVLTELGFSNGAEVAARIGEIAAQEYLDAGEFGPLLDGALYAWGDGISIGVNGYGATETGSGRHILREFTLSINFHERSSHGFGLEFCCDRERGLIYLEHYNVTVHYEEGGTGSEPEPPEDPEPPEESDPAESGNPGSGIAGLVLKLPADAYSSYLWNDHYYLFIDYEATWEEKERYCAAMGGYLASIGSQEENDALYEFMRQSGYRSAYFGFSDADEEGTWVWSSGESVGYTNWHAGEPNNEGSSEDYAMFYYQFEDGTWNDGGHNNWTTTNDTDVFICEIPKNSFVPGVIFPTTAEPTERMDYYESGAIRWKEEYDANGVLIRDTWYYENGQIESLDEWNSYGDRVTCVDYYEDGTVRYCAEFDDKGNLLVETYYYEDGKIDCKYEYESDGTMLRDTWYYESGNLRSLKEWDSYGHQTTMVEYYEDGTVSYRCEFDNYGNTLTRISYRENGTIQWKEEYESDGTLLRDTWYYENGQIESLEEWNSYGDRITSVDYYEDGTVRYRAEFDDKGNLLVETYYYEDGKIDCKYEYESDGTLLRDTWYYESGQIESLEEWNSYGDRITSVDYYEDSTVSYRAEFDDKGNMLVETYYYEDGAIDCKYEYEADGTMIRDTWCYESGQVRSLKEWNGNGDWITRIEYYEDGTVSYRAEFDDKGNMLVETYYYEDGAIDCKYEYEADGTMIRDTWYYESGQIRSLKEWSPDGKQTAYVDYYEDGAISYRCEYDADGNWIRQTWYNRDGSIDYEEEN